MRFLRSVIPSILAVVVLCPGNGWAQEDMTLECVTAEESAVVLTMEVTHRSNYDANTHPYDSYINLDDCDDDEVWEITYTATGHDISDDLVLHRGNGCVEDTGTPFTGVECTEVVDIIDGIDDGGGDFEITVSQILAACENFGSEILWFALFPRDDRNNHLAYCTRSFKYDMVATEPPTVTDASGSDSGARLDWEHSSTDADDHDEYIIYCDSSAGAGAVAGSSDCEAAASLPAGSDYDSLTSMVCATIEDGTTSSTRVADLTNGRDYAFSLATVDSAGNIGLSSTPICATPTPVDDFFNYYLSAGGEAGFCFVATAAYDGNYDHPDIMQLRWFRDHMLRRFPGGTWVIQQYYRYGPDLASGLESQPRLLSFVRSTLEVSTNALRVGRAGGLWWSVFLGVLLLGFCLRLRRRGAS